MAAGKRGVAGRVPVLCQDDGFELRHKFINRHDNIITSGHGKGASGAKINLYVNHNQRCLRHLGPFHKLGTEQFCRFYGGGASGLSIKITQ